MFTAVYLPDSNLTRQGFASEDSAERYIISRNCRMCADDGVNSACAAEWLVVSDDEYNKSTGIEDLFKAAGFVKQS